MPSGGLGWQESGKVFQVGGPRVQRPEGSRAEGTGACGGRRHSFLHPGVRSGLWEAARLSRQECGELGDRGSGWVEL